MKARKRCDWFFYWALICLSIGIIKWAIPRDWIPGVHDAVCWEEHEAGLFLPAEAFRGE